MGPNQWVPANGSRPMGPGQWVSCVVLDATKNEEGRCKRCLEMKLNETECECAIEMFRGGKVEEKWQHQWSVEPMEASSIPAEESQRLTQLHPVDGSDE